MRETEKRNMVAQLVGGSQCPLEVEVGGKLRIAEVCAVNLLYLPTCLPTQPPFEGFLFLARSLHSSSPWSVP